MGAIAPDADVGKFGMRKLVEAYSDTPLYTEAVERFLFHQLDETGMEEFIKKINEFENKTISFDQEKQDVKIIDKTKLPHKIIIK